MLKFNVPPLQRFLLFILTTFICLMFCSVITYFLTRTGTSAPRIRIATLIQDVFVFILPAIVTAVFITRRPADFLCLRGRLTITAILLVTATVVAAIPAMEYLIHWNENISLPESLGKLEQWMRESETSARKMIETMIGVRSIASLIMALLIMALLAGFSEEIFFRGCIQRLFSTSGINAHVAVWLTSFIFSAIHLQFFGFFPRLLLGAWFGYLMVWSGSIWPAVWGHVLNNSLAVIDMWKETATEKTAAMPSAWLAVTSLVCVVVLIVAMPRLLGRNQLR